MTQYTAWNGHVYAWPPPEGWHLAADGRWWPAEYQQPPPPNRDGEVLQPAPPVASPAQPSTGNAAGQAKSGRKVLAWSVVGVFVFLVLLGVAGSAGDEPSRSTSAAPISTAAPASPTASSPFADHAEFLRGDCPNVETPGQSLLVAVQDGDDACAQAVGIVLTLVGFDRDALLATRQDNGVRSDDGRYKLSVIVVSDGVLVGIDET